MALLSDSHMKQLVVLYEAIKETIDDGLTDCTTVYDVLGEDLERYEQLEADKETIEAARYQADEFRTHFEAARDDLFNLRIALTTAGVTIKEDD